MVERRGVEPLTSSLPAKRSPTELTPQTSTNYRCFFKKKQVENIYSGRVFADEHRVHIITN